MANVKFKKTTSTNLDSVPISDGQIVAVTDTGELHIDFDGVRTEYCHDVDLSAYVTTETFDEKVNSPSVKIGAVAKGSGTSHIAVGNGANSAGAFSVAIGNSASTSGLYALAIGSASNCEDCGVALGGFASVNNQHSVAIGYYAVASNDYAIQLGRGTNSTASTLSVGLSDSNNYLLLTSDGKIPIERIPDGVGGSSWTKYDPDTSTTDITLTIGDLCEYTYTASATKMTLTVNADVTGAILHFSVGSTAASFTCANVKFIGLHCYAGTFLPAVNTRYTVLFSYDGVNVVGTVGGYSIE